MTTTKPSMFAPAVKQALKARVALCGPTGSGKTWTALSWAQTLAGEDGRTAMIDSERGTASLYSDRYTFDTMRFDPPYDPNRLIEAVRNAEAAGYAVVVIDSFSHFWEGEGGVLDVVDGAAQRAHGNTFAGWKTGTPLQRRMVDAILGLDMHVIVTMRSKMEYIVETDSRGKQVPRKVGLSPVQRAGIEYEWTIVGDMDLEHRMVISKSRCAELADMVVQPNREAEAAEMFMAWLGSGEEPPAPGEVAAIVAGLNEIPNDQARKAAKNEFVNAFGRPEYLPASRVDEAREWVAEQLGQHAPADTSAA